MRAPIAKDDIAPAAVHTKSKAIKQRQSVSLPPKHIEQLNCWVETLIFDHRIKNASLSELVEYALTDFFKQRSIESVADMAKRKRL